MNKDEKCECPCDDCARGHHNECLSKCGDEVYVVVE